MSLIASLVGPVADIIGKMVPDKNMAAAMAHDIASMTDKIANEQVLAQLKVNEAEASSGSLFKGGWRPMVGWCCCLALFWTYILQPFLVFGLLVAGVDLPALPELQTGDLMPILLGMLGLTAARSYEKTKGVSAK